MLIAVERMMDPLTQSERCSALLAELLGEANGGDTRMQYEIYLALHGTASLEIGGYLVTEKGSVDRVVAFCPVKPVCSGELRTELARQLEPARRVAAGELNADADDPAILWLRHDAGPLPIPLWIYSLACIPLAGDWDGRFQTPCPFSPAVMERMAAQPEAMAWLRKRKWSQTSAS
jgi:hypothetical protein